MIDPLVGISASEFGLCIGRLDTARKHYLTRICCNVGTNLECLEPDRACIVVSQVTKPRVPTDAGGSTKEGVLNLIAIVTPPETRSPVPPRLDFNISFSESSTVSFPSSFSSS